MKDNSCFRQLALHFTQFRLIWFVCAGLLANLTNAQSPACIDFEIFAEDATFTNGQSIIEAGFGITFGPYTDGNDSYFENAFIAASSPHQGQSLGFGSAAATINVGCAQEVSLRFASAAGGVDVGVNVGVNGQLHIPKSLDEVIDLGGVTVIISSSGQTGEIRFIANPTAIQTILVGGVEFFVDHICTLRCGGNDRCLDFEGLGSQTFRAGDSFSENDRVIEIRNLAGQEGAEAFVSQSNTAGHLGNELFLSKATAFLDAGCANGLSVRVNSTASGVFLAINGASATATHFANFNGQTLGGVAIAVIDEQMILTGELSTFEIGGIAVYLDHLCVGPCIVSCIDFEIQTGGTNFGKGDSLFENGIEMIVDTFEKDALVVIEEREQRAGHLGQDAALFDATLNFLIPCAVEISLHFGQYAEGVMVSVNGDVAIVDSLDELNGAPVGGALLEVSTQQINGALIGTLRVTGTIGSFIIGGTEIVIDHVCHVPCPNPGCVDFETFPLGQTFSDGDVFFEEFTRMTVSRHGAISEPATVTIGNDNIAGGGGKEAILDKALITFSFLCAQRVEFSYARLPDGLPGVRLGVNGDVVQVNNFASENGQSLGGASIEVIGTADAGRVIITSLWQGGITSVLVGGNAVALDNICHVECTGGQSCANFDNLPAGATYSWEVGNQFDSGGLTFMPSPLTLSDEEIIEDGQIAVSDANKANYAGNELYFENASVSVVAACMRDVSFRFGEYGGKVTLFVNGERASVDSFAELNGQTLGNPARSITVQTLPAPGGTIGYLRIAGTVSSLEIGGQNLYVDQLCYTDCPAPIDLGRAFMISDTPISATHRQLIVEVEFSGSGTLILQRSTTLAPDSWTTQDATITTPSGRPNIRRFTFNIPIETDRIFFRGRVTP